MGNSNSFPKGKYKTKHKNWIDKDKCNKRRLGRFERGTSEIIIRNITFFKQKNVLQNISVESTFCGKTTK